jgi:hypothetical protein
MGKLRWFIVTTAAVVAVVLPTWGFSLIVSHTKAGHAYKVNAHSASRFKGFIHDLEANGRPIRVIGCYAKWGHIRHSYHHMGNACDIEQYGFGRTTYHAMYHIRGLAHKWGLRDGCEFGDCGHIDTGDWRDQAPAGMVAAAEIPDSTVGDAPTGEWPVTLTPKPQLASTESKPLVNHKTKVAVHHSHNVKVAAHHVHHRRYVSNESINYLFQRRRIVVAGLQEDIVTRREKEKTHGWLFYSVH